MSLYFNPYPFSAIDNTLNFKHKVAYQSMKDVGVREASDHTK